MNREFYMRANSLPNNVTSTCESIEGPRGRRGRLFDITSTICIYQGKSREYM